MFQKVEASQLNLRIAHLAETSVTGMSTQPGRGVFPSIGIFGSQCCLHFCMGTQHLGAHNSFILHKLSRHWVTPREPGIARSGAWSGTSATATRGSAASSPSQSS